MTSETKPRVVYKLVRTDKPEDGTDVYVGSTSLSLKERLRYHRGHAKLGNSKLYTRMTEVGTENWRILPLVICPCSKYEIRTLEQQWVGLLKPDLNIFFPFANNYETRCRQVDRDLYHNNIRDKVYYCDICDKSFGYLGNLKYHLRTLKHSYAYMNSVD